MRIVVCDDNRLFVEPLGTALRSRGHEVVVATLPAQALQAVEDHDPDVCVIDLRFPEGDGREAVAEVRRRRPGCQVVVLSASDDPRDAAATIAAGAVAFLRKDQPITAIFDVVERVAAGGAPGALPVSAASPRPSQRSGHQLVAMLTAREREVLKHLVAAEDTVKIARSLGVEPSTARTHLQNVLTKLGVHSRVQAVALALDAGIHHEY